MRITYSKDADALAVEFVKKAKSVSCKRIARNINADFDAAGRLICLEVLFASDLYPVDDLWNLVEPIVWLTLAEAAKKSGLSASTLRGQINKGKLAAKKRGPDWVVALHELYNYMERREMRGRPAAQKRARPRKSPH